MGNSKKDLRKVQKVLGKEYEIYSLKLAKENGLDKIDRLPKSLKVLLENILRHQDGENVTWDDAKALNEWVTKKTSEREINYYPARVIMQDFTGVPGVVDLAACREGMVKLGGNPESINPLTQVDLVIDHSVNVDKYGTADSFEENVKIEYKNNNERYQFLKWGQSAFKKFRVVPPGTGIVHQVNLEYLADCVWTEKNEKGVISAYPDTCVGTDSHTTMINGLAVLGWGVGGIEAEAAMLGQSITMVIPDVVGFKITGKLNEGVTGTDLVLVVVQMLRKHGVVEKFVEFFGPGMKDLPLADRATLANMAPEYGATCGFFPIDKKTIEYLKFSGRKEETVALVEAYAKEQGMWLEENEKESDYPVFTSILELDLSSVRPSIAGPKRPQDRISLDEAAANFKKELGTGFGLSNNDVDKKEKVEGRDFEVKQGDVVIAAITSCTNTSNPTVMIGAGILAKKANERGLKVKPWVKTSLAPGSKVVTDYLVESGLQSHLDSMGFQLVGYGCTTCIGNSGPLNSEISKAIQKGNLVAASVLSGNRNFEGRINPDVRANYLMSPPLVVAYAIAGSMKIDLTKDSLGVDKNGKDVYLKDIWPSNAEISNIINSSLTSMMFQKRYANVFEGDKHWQSIKTSGGKLYQWDPKSTYVRNPPFFEDITGGMVENFQVKDARILAILGDMVTTDHISPASVIKKDGPAGKYLSENGVSPIDFNSFGSRRGNHEVMMRGTFANIRIKNEMIPGVEGGYTKHIPSGEQLSIYDASMKYQKEGIPLVIFGGMEYGAGSSRDWAAKGTMLLGVKAVITESYERIHRSNLVGMGVIPLEFKKGVSRKTLKLNGSETITLSPVGKMAPNMTYNMTINRGDGKSETIELSCRVDTAAELLYLKNGGILPFVLRKIKEEQK